MYALLKYVSHLTSHTRMPKVTHWTARAGGVQVCHAEPTGMFFVVVHGETKSFENAVFNIFVVAVNAGGIMAVYFVVSIVRTRMRRARKTVYMWTDYSWRVRNGTRKKCASPSLHQRQDIQPSFPLRLLCRYRLIDTRALCLFIVNGTSRWDMMDPGKFFSL